MSWSNAASRDNSTHLEGALTLLEDALHIIDDHADAPELGARLQEVIDRLKAKMD